jgi:hypothetical protein
MWKIRVMDRIYAYKEKTQRDSWRILLIRQYNEKIRSVNVTRES